MIEAPAEEADGPAPRPELDALRAKIGWICHSARAGAALYAVWLLFELVRFWTNKAAVASGWGYMLGKDLLGIAFWQIATAFAVNLLIWLFAAAACYGAWRLFTGYLNGSILTAASSDWLGRTAWYGLIAEGLDVATRPLIAIVLTLHFPAGEHQRAVVIFFQPQDLLVLLMMLAILALASVQKTAAVIAEEHRHMV
jgi:hypothetical protein